MRDWVVKKTLPRTVESFVLLWQDKITRCSYGNSDLPGVKHMVYISWCMHVCMYILPYKMFDCGFKLLTS